MRKTNLRIAFAVVGGFLCAGAVASAEERRELFLKSHERFLEVLRPAAAEASLSTVRLTADGDEIALGTVVAADGWIITKASQLGNATTPEVRFSDGKSVTGQVVGVDDEYDLALLKVNRVDLTPVRFTESKEAAVGNWVLSPDNDGRPVAAGVISVATRSLPEVELRRFRDMAKGGFLGVQMETIDAGVRITQVLKDTGAEKAGLKVGDIIVALGKTEIDDQNVLGERLRGRKPGDVIQLKILRDDESKSFEATLGKRPPDSGGRSNYQNNLGSSLSEVRAGFPTILQHDTVITPADCGGPLVDLDGRVLGVNIARAGRTESYAIPSEVVLEVVTKLRRSAPSVKAEGEGDE